MEHLEGRNFKNVAIKRVHKRFLSPETTLVDRTRVADMFRVVYSVNASKEIEEQRIENPEVFEKLGEDVLESLKNSIESFEDFDFVVFSSEITCASAMGAARTYALNEQAIKGDERLTYGKDWNDSRDALQGARDLCIVGDGDESLEVFALVKDAFFSDLCKSIKFITSEKIPFSNSDSTELLASFQDFLSTDRRTYEAEIAEFEAKVREWRGLEPHYKAKTPTPTEPKPRLQIYNSAVVSSVDKLLDRDGLFLTIEGSELLGSSEQLKTIACDHIFIDQGRVIDSTKITGLCPSEEGFYNLYNGTLDDIKNDMLRFFSKA